MIKIKNIAAHPLDWNLIFEESLYQKVFPLVYQNIITIVPDAPPAGILKKYQAIYAKNATKNLYYSAFLIRISKLFNERNIKILPFKGPVLSQDLYGGIEFRQFSDLDILVSKKDAIDAWQLLLDSGFQSELTLNKSQRAGYIKVEDHIALSRKNMVVELHWEMSGLYTPRQVLYETVSNHLSLLNFSGQNLPNLSTEHLVVYLSVHACKHGWANLEAVANLSELLKRDCDLDKIVDLASKWQCKKMLHLGLYLSHKLLGTRMPGNLQFYKNSVIAEIGNNVSAVMFKNLIELKVKDTANRFSFFHLNVRDSFINKLQYVFRLIFRPTDKDWLCCPVPGSFGFIHYVIRPFRLIYIQLSKLYA